MSKKILIVTRLTIVHVAMDGVDQFSSDVIHRYEVALTRAGEEGTRVRALLLSNPHNPLGKPIFVLKLTVRALSLGGGIST